MSEDSTISFKINSQQGGQTRHYNKNGIVYLTVVDTSITIAGWLFIISPFILGLISTIEIDDGDVRTWFIMLGALLSVIIFVYLREADRAALGTLNGIDDYEENSVDILENAIRGNIDNIISISGTTIGPLVSREYRYHFCPKNIVSLETRVRNPIPIGLVVVLLIALLSGAGLFEFVAPSENASIIAILFFLSAIGVILFYFFISIPVLEVRLQNGETRLFEMSQQDLSKITNDFTER
jgi:hypothetical protein